MSSVSKKIAGLGKKRVLASWIAVVATLLLGAEILWTVNEVWPTLEMWTKLVIILCTFLVVVIFGWRKSPAQKARGVL